MLEQCHKVLVFYHQTELAGIKRGSDRELIQNKEKIYADLKNSSEKIKNLPVHFT